MRVNAQCRSVTRALLHLRCILSRISVICLASLLPVVGHAVPTTLEQAWTQAYQNNSSLEALRASALARNDPVALV
jgi:hypothetical protein